MRRMYPAGEYFHPDVTPDWGDRHGLVWRDAPIPPRFHRCRVWSYGWWAGTRIERCACGGTRYDGGAWFGG